MLCPIVLPGLLESGKSRSGAAVENLALAWPQGFVGPALKNLRCPAEEEPTGASFRYLSTVTLVGGFQSPFGPTKSIFLVLAQLHYAGVECKIHT